MSRLLGWGLFALLAAIIALSYPPREHTQKEKAVSQFDMGAPTTLAVAARVIHIQKDSPPNTQADIPLWTYERQAPALRKGDIAYATSLPVSLPTQVAYGANQVSTARESHKAATGLHAPRNRVLLFWNDSRRSRLT